MPRSAARLENRAATSYLIAYNFAQGLGWLFVTLRLIEVLIDTLDYRPAYETVGALVRRLQLVAILEVLHAALGLVRSSPVTALMQWAGRTHVLMAIIGKLPEVQTHYSVCLTFAAWSLTEIIRYPQYGLTGIGICPRWLTWMRYTLFIVLYPVGIYGEMVAMYTALGPIKDHDLYSGIFRELPFTYHTFIVVSFLKLWLSSEKGQIFQLRYAQKKESFSALMSLETAICPEKVLLIVYPLLFLVLYRHMFKQRWKKLSPRRPPRSGRAEREGPNETDGQRIERGRRRTDRED